MEVTGGRRQTSADHSRRGIRRLRVNRRGLFFYAKTAARPTSLWRVPAWGGEEIEIFSGLKSWANFAVLGNGIYFRPEDPAPNGFWVQFYDFRTKRVSTVREVNNRAGTGLAVEPGARWMVFSVKAFRGGDLFLVDGFL